MPKIKYNKVKMNILYLSIAAVIGCLSRFSIDQIIRTLPSNAWVISTIIVNLIGCFVIGFLNNKNLLPNNPQIKTIVSIGFIGCLTTYSSFTKDLIDLFREQSFLHSCAYVLTTITLGVIIFLLAEKLSKMLF